MATYLENYIQEQYDELHKELTHDDKFSKEHSNTPDSMVNLHEILKDHKNQK